MDSINIHRGMTNIVHSPGDGSLKHSTRRRRDGRRRNPRRYGSASIIFLKIQALSKNPKLRGSRNLH